MTLIIYMLIGLLAAKVIWNLSVPYRLLSRLRLHVKGQPKNGISLSLEIEIILLLIILFLSWFSTGLMWKNHTNLVLIICGGSILFSYIHFFIVGMIGGWIITHFFQRP
jgi:uncharacterized membrane protein YuzA (DUF378 family)